MIRVLIVDDHAVVRRGLREIVAEAPEMAVADEAASGAEALRLVRDADYDVVLLDLALPDLNGLDVLRQIRAERPAVRVLILNVHPEEQYAVRALRSGAAGYLTKDSAPGELVEAIRQAAAGSRYVSRPLAERLAALLAGEAPPDPLAALSDREFQVLRMLGAGRTVGEIAAALSLSDKTISTYRGRLLLKLRLSTTAELIRYAIEHDLKE